MEFWTDLSGIQLSDNNDEPTWIQALPLNEYSHPIYGKIKITAEKVNRFVENFKAKVRGTDLDIDYDHKAKVDHAAGWVKDVEARLNESDPKKNGLWYLVKWTTEARRKIEEKEYRYFSSEFKDEWKNPIDNKTYKDVLFGGGLTNRPFLKDISPINLSEITDEPTKEGTVDIEKLRKQLNLPETATEDEVLAAVAALQAEGEKPKEDPKTDPNADSKTDPQAEKELSEGEEQLLKLAEDNPVIKFLLDDREETRKQLADLQKGHKASTISTKLSEIHEGAKVTLPPAAIEAAKELAERDDVSVELSDAIFDVLGTVAKAGVVELGERGKAGEVNGDSAKKLTDAIDKHMKDNKVDYATALTEVAAADPTLYETYLNELVEV